MRIEHGIVLDQYPVTILTGRVADQAVLIGVIKTLFLRAARFKQPECVEAQEASRRGSGRQCCGLHTHFGE
jgi:hypothetical protein